MHNIAEADPLLQIEGLDLETGLHYAANNRKLYETLLRAFAANNSNTVADIRAALSADDMATAKRTVHSLKGLAATIGAKALKNAAKAVETAIIDGQPDAARNKLLKTEALIEKMLRQIHCALMPKTEEPA